MTRSLLFAAAALAIVFAGPALAAPTPEASTKAPTSAAHTLTLTVEGVRSSKGQIMAALLKADPVSGKAIQTAATTVAAKDGAMTLVFSGLADGAYAVQLFHDEDGDGKMSTNLFGIPTEGYAFSNRAKAGFGPPSFANMKVDVAGAETSTVAIMAY